VRFTIERLRTLVLVAGILLLAALAAFLVVGKVKHSFNAHDLPKKLGVDIQQEANGFTRAEFRAGKAVFRITASKVEQLKDGHFRLHGVKIELYGAQGQGIDRIEGNEFEYDQHAGIARAAGPVEITLTRPADTPAVISGGAREKMLKDMPATGPLAAAVADSKGGAMHVKTSGLEFNQKTGVARTAEHVEFAVAQSSGTAIGAEYDSQKGELVLDRSVAMQTHRGNDVVALAAQHAAFNRDDHLCRLTQAAVTYQSGEARATDAVVQFHEDGTADRLDATHGFALTTSSGGRIAAPTATLVFGAQNQPQRGHLQGGVTMDEQAQGRTTHGAAPTADLNFGRGGTLHSARLSGGVQMISDDATGATRTHRAWNSPAADLAFRSSQNGQLALDTMHGIGGVVVTSQTVRNGVTTPARFSADDVTGVFGAASALTAMTGIGHAALEQTTQQGAHQVTSGDRIEARFTAAAKQDAHRRTAASQIDSATVTGHVVLLQQPKPGAAAQAALRATAARAVYEGAGAWLHLTGSPRVDNGGLQLAADRIDVSQESGDAFAHGNVKASWLGDSARPGARLLGGQGPAHVIAAEAQLQQATGEATFMGQARLWQQANSIAAPVITLDRTRRTLTAHASSPTAPVRVVMQTASFTGPGGTKSANSAPAVVRIHGGDLKYSDAERKAVMRGGAAGAVVAETTGAVTRSDEVDLTLLPPGNHAGRDGGSAQVDRMTARGHVSIESQGRRGAGDKLVYSGEEGTYTLTGSPAAPPRLTDPARGTVTGEALIFNSRDDSVIVEGGGRETTTDTMVPKQKR
jgi:lipopolysaccharide export system protein LptA